MRRETRFDVLRVLSCFMIVLLHVSAMYLNEFDGVSFTAGEVQFAALMRLMTPFAVPSFVMLSGAFLIREKNADFRYFYKKALRSIVVPTLIYSVLYVLMHYAEIVAATILGVGVSEDKIDYLEPLMNWLRGQPHVTLWYMYMIIGLYLIVPFLVYLKEKISAKLFVILAFVMLIIGAIIDYTCELIWIVSFVKWIGYFLIGNVIYSYSREIHAKLKRKSWPTGITLIVLSYLTLIAYWYVSVICNNILKIPESFSALIIVGSIIQFLGFSLLISEKAAPKFIDAASKYSMDIYLIHPFFLEVMMQYFGRIRKDFPNAISIPVMTIIVFIMSGIIAMVIDKIVCRIRNKSV